MEEFTKNWLDIHLIHQTDFNTLFKNWKNDVQAQQITEDFKLTPAVFMFLLMKMNITIQVNKISQNKDPVQLTIFKINNHLKRRNSF